MLSYIIFVADDADIVCGAKNAPHDKIFMWSNYKLLYICNVEQVMWLLCRDLRSFDAIFILSQFMHFCVEQKFS